MGKQVLEAIDANPKLRYKKGHADTQRSTESSIIPTPALHVSQLKAQMNGPEVAAPFASSEVLVTDPQQLKQQACESPYRAQLLGQLNQQSQESQPARYVNAEKDDLRQGDVHTHGETALSEQFLSPAAPMTFVPVSVDDGSLPPAPGPAAAEASAAVTSKRMKPKATIP